MNASGGQTASKRVAVVGAGIAGLSMALRLSADHDVAVFERESTPGGKIHSEHLGGFLFDWGPNGFLSSAAELRDVVREAGCESELAQAAPAASKRYIYWGGKLHALPSAPPGALSMSLLSVSGKLRAAREPFVRARPDARDGDESVHAFFARRFGREVADRVVAPALLGITGGDASATSVASLFPRLLEMEREHGSVIRAMMRGRRTPGRLSSFGAGGMQHLTDAVAAKLGNRLRLGCAVERVEPGESGWRIVHAGGEFHADAVSIATPSDAAAAILETSDAELAELLRGIAYAPMRVAGVAFRSQDVPVPLDGFGFLAARGQGVRILGALFTSTIYPSQAPPDTAYLRVFLGGATDRGAVGLDAASARGIVLADLAKTLGITAEPVAYHEAVWPHAIPQYALDHRARLARIDERVAAHRGLTLAGNAYRGLGLSYNVRDSLAVATRIA